MLSGLDLLKGTSTQPAKTGLDLLQRTAPIKGEIQVKTGLDLLRQPVATEAPTTAAPVMPDVHPAAAYLEKFTKPPIGELGVAKYQMGPLITAENTAPAMDTLGRLWNLAQHPYDVVKGAAVFASEIPGFVGGLASAIGQVPIEILKGGTILDWYNASARNMQTISGLWHQGVSAPLGKLLETPEKMGEELAQTMFGAEPEVRKDETELMGEIFMVPYTAVATPLHQMADSPTWDNHPNVRGILKFGADALGLVTMGLVFKGGPVAAARRVDPIIKRAHDIDGREKAIDASGLDEILKDAQKKVLDAEKRQLELEIESLKKELDHEKLAKEDLKEKGIEVEKAKKGIEVEVEAVREERLKFAKERVSIEKLPKGIEPISKTTTGTHFSSNIESFSGGIRQRDLGFSVARDLSEEQFSPRLQEPKGTKGRVSVEVGGRGLDYSNPIHRKYIEDLFDEIETTGKKPYDIAVLNRLRSEGIDWVDNFNGIGKGEELHVINQDIIRITDIDTKVIRPGGKEEPKTGIKLIKKMPPKPIEEHVLDIPDFHISEKADIIKRVGPEEYSVTILENRYGARIERADGQEVLRVRGPELPKEGVMVIENQLSIYGLKKPWIGKYKPEYRTERELLPDTSKILTPEGIIDIEAERARGAGLRLVEKMPPKPIEIPDFKHTEEALAFGEVATPKQIEVLESKRAESLLKSNDLRDKGDFQGAMDEAVRGQLFREAIESYKEGIEKPITNLDLQTGLKEPIKLSTESSPFRETPERTQAMKDIYAERAEAVRSNPELMTNKLLNDVNRWLDGEELPVEKAKNDLSELAVRAEELERSFISRTDFIRWKDTVSDAASWARKADRPKFERTITEPAMSVELKQLHEHKARVLGFEKAGGSFVEGYLKNMAKAAEKTDMKAAMDVYDAFDMYKKGNIEQASLKAEKVLGKLHKAEKKRLSREAGPTLYTGLPLDEAVKQLKEMAKHTAEFMKEFKGSFKEKEFDFGHAVKQVKADTLRSLWDQSETLLNVVKNRYPKEYDRIVSRQRSAVTGIGYGKVLYGQAVKEIYGGMSKEMINAINAYILARRFKDIYGYRVEKGYKHQPGYGATQTSNTSAMIEMIKDIPPDAWKDLASKVPEIETLFGKLTPEEMASVVKAGDAYFEWSRKIIDDLVEIGIKSPEEGALLKAHDFRKFKTMLIKKLYDFNYDLQLKGETIKVSNSGVLELGSGSSKILEPDSRVVLSEQMARAYGSIAHQAAALEWKGLANRHPDNGFVSIKKQSGWSPIPYMADGVRKNIYFHPDVIKYLVTRSRDISPRLAIAIRGLTLAPVTRALAVGLSPIWSTFAGLPMDIMHSLWAARTWEADAKGVRPKASFPFYETRDGKFRKVYSPFAGVDALQIGLDMKRTFKDVYSRGPLTENLMKHGLVMNFLTQRMNRYMKGVKPPGDWAKTMDILSYHGLSMELWARVATADRVIRRDAKKLGVTYEQALKNDDIMYRAAHAGRDRMDYNQGGWFVKALDQSGMIFLNAAVLGTRTFWRQAKDNPVDFTFRTAQLGITAAGLTAAAWSLYPEVMKDQSASANKRDVTWPIAPDWLKVKDVDGNDVTFHFKLRMDPNAAFLYRVFEGLTKTYMYDQGLILEEPDYKELVGTLKHLGPVDVKLPPAIQASVDYVTNYSWWKDRHMYTELGGKTFDWPQSQYEGMYDPRVPQIAKDVAGVTKLSPKRLAGTVSNVIPSNNEFVWLMNGAYEQAFSDLPEEVRRQHWLITLAETPGFNKVIGMTRHGQGRWKVKSDIENEVELKQMVMNSKFDMLATQNAWYGVKNKEKLFKFMKEQEFDDYNRMVDIFKFIKDPVVKSLPHRDFWLSMRHSSIEGRAKTWVELLERSSEGEKEQLMDELNQVMIVGGVVTPEFMKEVSELKGR